MKFVHVLLVTLVFASLFAAPAMAQQPAAPAAAAVEVPNWAKGLGAGIAAGLTIIGAGYGISAIGARAVESMARQPEVAGNIQGAMIISAALIEGVTFFSLIVAILILVLG